MKSRQNRPSLRNATRDGVIATEVFEAGSLWERAAGLLAHPPLQAGQAMWLEPCGSIHTWGMRYPIDVLYLDRSHQVLDVVQHLRPWRIAIAPRGTRVTVELPAGAAGKVRRGDQLTLEREGN